MRLGWFLCIFASESEKVPSSLSDILSLLFTTHIMLASTLLRKEEDSILLLAKIILFLSFHIFHKKIDGEIINKML